MPTLKSKCWNASLGKKSLGKTQYFNIFIIEIHRYFIDLNSIHLSAFSPNSKHKNRVHFIYPKNIAENRIKSHRVRLIKLIHHKNLNQILLPATKKNISWTYKKHHIDSPDRLFWFKRYYFLMESFVLVSARFQDKIFITKNHSYVYLQTRHQNKLLVLCSVKKVK